MDRNEFGYELAEGAHAWGLLLLCLLFVTLTGLALAQETTPDPVASTETPSLTPTASETPTPTLLPSPTEPPIPSPTLPPSETPTIEPAPVLPTAEPTLSETPVEVTAETTLEVTPEVTDLVTEAPTATGTASATPLPSEPEMGLFFADHFEFGDARDWLLGAGWSLEPVGFGLGLQLLYSAEPATLVGGDLFNVAAQVQVRLDAGAFRLNLRESAAGSYSLALESGGLLRLYRGNQELASGFVGASNGQWRTLRLAAIDGLLRVRVDGTEVIVLADEAPLPSGFVSMTGDSASAFVVGDFELYIPLTELVARSLPGPLPAAINSAPVMPAPMTTGLSRIVFTSDRDVANPNTEIYVMNADGSNVLRLTTNAFIDRSPDWSPDDTQLVFESRRDDDIGIHIYTMNADGSNPTRLTVNGLYNWDPAWSPDGRIAFESSIGYTRIYVMNADGSDIHQVSPATGNAGDPAWSPDGTRIAFSLSLNGNTEIHVMDDDGANLIRLTNHAASDYGPAWSPDGTRIAFTSQRTGKAELYVMDVNGGNVQQVTNSVGHNTMPGWSPDGTQLVFQSLRDGNVEVYVVDLQTPCSVGPNPYPVARLTNNPAGDSSPSWSHTGTTGIVPTCPATPTPTPTPYHPNTSLDFNGVHSGLKAVMFWAIFNESSSDNFDSGHIVDSDMGNPRFTSFLMSPPYYSASNPPGDNLAEPGVVDTPYGDWYIRHGSFDYRYMAAQTIINGFLSYERRFGLGSVFEYARNNFGGSINNPNYYLWQIDLCKANQYGDSFEAAFLQSNRNNSYSPIIGWLIDYLDCVKDLDPGYMVSRINRSLTTIAPQIQLAITDFYSSPWDPTDGAFGLLAANHGGATLVSCVGGCQLQVLVDQEYQCAGPIVYTYEATAPMCFVTLAGLITQSDIDAAYQLHMSQLLNPVVYTPDQDSILQPVLEIQRDNQSGEDQVVLGYRWISAVYQQSADRSHVPR